jgi:hypothetical protein
MAEVIRDHQPTTGMSVASGVTCRCGYWNGNERAGVDRPAGFQGLIWHQGQELEAAGFGPVKAAKAEAWDEGYDEAEHEPIYSHSPNNPYRAASVEGDA